MAVKSVVSHPLEVSLRLIGAWPDSSCRIWKNIIWTIMMSTFLIFQYWYCIKHLPTDTLADLLEGLSVTLSNTLLFLKFIIVWFHNRLFSDIVLTIIEDWNNCKSECSMEIMMEKAALSHRIVKLTLILFACTESIYAASIFFVPEDDAKISEPNQKKFLLRMEFPFEPTISPVYEIIVTVQIVVQYMFTIMAGMFMALIATFVLHVASQIDVVCDGLMQILDPCHDRELRLSTVKTLIDKHQRIISLSDNIESVFTMISLLQFFLNIVVICFVSFILVTTMNAENGSTSMIQCFAYIMALYFEAFILCYTGEYLSSKSENVGWVAYNSNWYELSIQENRALLLLILRSQKPITLTVGKFANLSLQTFANMLKASASYVSVLYAME